MEKSIVGEVINFRGLIYGPRNEKGVLFLFGSLAKELGFYVEEFRNGFPDLIARRKDDKGWRKVTIEVETQASHFRKHRHNPAVCDLIICWENDWPDAPFEVIELKRIVHSLTPKPLPIKPSYGTLGHFERLLSRDGLALLEKIDQGLMGLDGAVVRNIRTRCLSYKVVGRVFTYIEPSLIHHSAYFFTSRINKSATKRQRKHVFERLFINHEDQVKALLVRAKEALQERRKALRRFTLSHIKGSLRSD